MSRAPKSPTKAAANATPAIDPALQAARALTAAANSALAAATAGATSAPPPPRAIAPTATSAASADASSTGLLPYALLTREEQKTFQAKFRAAQRSPQLVGLQIRALDQLVARLKQKRATAARITQESIAELQQLAKEEAMIHVKLDPIAGRMRANQAKRDELLARKADADEQMQAILSHTAAAVAKTKRDTDLFKQKQLLNELAFERGRTLRSPTPTKASRPDPF